METPSPSEARPSLLGRARLALLTMMLIVGSLFARAQAEEPARERVPVRAGALAPEHPSAHEGSAHERRHVLALVDGHARGWYLETQDEVSELAAMPLNHVGMVVRRHDIRQGPPPAELLDDVRAVVTWFSFTDQPCDWLWPWLEDVAAPSGVRFVHLSDFGPLRLSSAEGEAPEARLTNWLARFGLGHDGGYVDGPMGIEIEKAVPELLAVEGDPTAHADHRGPWAADDRSSPWVVTRLMTGEDRDRHPVVTGPWGGVALDPWVASPGQDEDRRMHLDLFAFFRDALGLRRAPAPDPSLLNGRRLFFCHVDGDGFESRSTASGGEFCAQVMLDEVFDAYDLPFTVSVIVGSLTDDLAIAEPNDRMRLATEIFTRPHVELASHGVLHPFWWNLAPEDATEDRPVVGYPKGLASYDYSPAAEVRDSIRFIDERLAPPGRRCEVMLWTGLANPPIEAIAEVTRLGRRNVNGGVFRWDPLFDSIGYVSPWGVFRGEHVQVYAGAANENDFDGFFTTMPSAFRHITTTIDRTGGTRVLKPANVYIHFYSAGNPGRLAALHGLLRRWGVEEQTAPVFASTYADAVHGAMTTARIARRRDGWELRDFGGCRTARFDDEPRFVDWTRSRGLLGARRVGERLFVHLAGPSADVVLSDTAVRHPHVIEANHLLDDGAISATGIAATSSSFARRILRLGGFAPRAPLALTVDGALQDLTADDDGRVHIVLDPGSSRVEVRVR